MTASTRTPDPQNARRRKRGKQQTRFSSMESLGFIESPATVSNTWWGTSSTSAEPIQAHPPLGPKAHKRGAHERTVADLEPNDTTELLIRGNVRWGLVILTVLLVGAVVVAAIWLWQRPATLAESAVSEVNSSASALEPELLSLSEINGTIGDPEVDPSAISVQTRAVDSLARGLFNAAGALPDEAGDIRGPAADVATSALDASRLINDAVAYRSAVIQILIPPSLETDPELIALDDAVRAFGTWQQAFNQVRSALPTGTMSQVSGELAVIAGNLEAIQSRYFDGLRDDDRAAAEEALDELAAQLSAADGLLSSSLAKVQERAAKHIQKSLSGIERLLG